MRLAYHVLVMLILGCSAEVMDFENFAAGAMPEDTFIGSNGGNIGLYSSDAGASIIDTGTLVGSRSLRMEAASGADLYFRRDDNTYWDAGDAVSSMSMLYSCAPGGDSAIYVYLEGPGQTEGDGSPTFTCDGTTNWIKWDLGGYGKGFNTFGVVNSDLLIDNFAINEASSVFGDPHIIGFDGSHFEFLGEAGSIYSFLSDKGIDVNALLFTARDDLEEATYVGSVGIKINDVKIEVHSNRSVFINSVPMKKGAAQTQAGSVQYDPSRKVVVEGENYVVEAAFITDAVMGGIQYLNLNFDIKHPTSPDGVVGRTALPVMKVVEELEALVPENFQAPSLFATKFDESAALGQKKNVLSAENFSFSSAQATRV